jgi:LmbE family N-acetylglucosaminyl deacetylase
MTVAATVGGYLEGLQRLPLMSPADLLAGRPLVVVAPHPDDESLGLGGLIAAAAALGNGVSVIFLTDGEGSHVGSPTFPPERLARLRRSEATAALAALGVPPECGHFLALGDTRLSILSSPGRLAAMDRMQAIAPPDALVCVTALTDPHGDHQGASALVRDTAWKAPVTVMHYPVWTWNASPGALPATAPEGFRIDVPPYLAMKRNAVAAHRSQHGGVIDDAVEAFELSAEFVDRLVGPTETLTWPT